MGITLSFRGPSDSIAVCIFQGSTVFWTGQVPWSGSLHRAMRKLGLAVVLASSLATGFVVSSVAAVPTATAGETDTAPAARSNSNAGPREFVRQDLRHNIRDTRPATPPDTVVTGALPPEARSTHQLILRGGPFPYAKDGTVFGNRERHLPPRPRGQYREYTVRTPGVPHRGARRIVCGGQQPARPEVCYYTADHYASFRRIAQ